MPIKKPTTWSAVAPWYDTLLEGSADTYQSAVIAPNLLRVLDLKKGDKVLDLACGQGFFSRLLHDAGARVTGADISAELIAIAKERSPKDISYKISPSHSLPFMTDLGQDAVLIVLALENIKDVAGTLAEASRVLLPNGRISIVLMHPAFRIPRDSGWMYDAPTQKQMRTISSYLSEKEYEIVMNPGETNKNKQVKTISYHRSLQWYMKTFRKAGLAITRLEEWISHKESGKGPRKSTEDTARKEIPMFLYVELVKIPKNT